MPLVECPDCGKELSDAAPSCPYCARPMKAMHPPVPNRSKPRSLRSKLSFIACGCLLAPILLIFIISLIGTFVGSGNSSKQAGHAPTRARKQKPAAKPEKRETVVKAKHPRESRKEPVDEPDWEARFREVFEEHYFRFEPPAVGDKVELKLVTGKSIKGEVAAIDQKFVRIKRGNGTVGFAPQGLTPETRVRFFAAYHAKQVASKIVAKEKAALEAQSATFQIVEKEDVSYANVVRKGYHVRVSREMTERELIAISTQIVKEATSNRDIDAIMIFFYLPESDPGGIFTAGKATWAPAGDWSKAATNLPPRLVVQAGGALERIPEEDVVDLSLAKKQQIFKQLVRNQDSGVGGEESYERTARQFGITTEEAKKIGLEGVVKGWPMPR